LAESRSRGVLLLVACAILALFVACGRGTTTSANIVEGPFLTDPSGGSLSTEEASAVLAEAEAKMRARPAEFVPEAKCWFDRLPSGVASVVCGPTVDPSSETQPELGPPYYSVLGLDTTQRADGSLRLSLSGMEPTVLSFADYPVDLFRPDGEKLRP
jgi:hypothetical protein